MRIPLYILLSLFLVGASCAQPVAQLGVVAVQEDARATADLLTASLGSHTNIILVERGELDKVMRERGFARGQRSNLAEVGKLLHADGLVLLETVRAKNATNLAVRLIAVNSGVVLDAALYPFPLSDLTHWTSLAAGRIARLQPKLLVPRERAIPVSILNLHAGVATPQAAETERALSTLLFHRLALEPEVFVLERRQLGRAGFEKTLALNDKEFWTGGYLLEGVIDRDITSRDTVTVNAQLIPPGNGKPIAVEASGARQNLSELAEGLARRILGELRVGTANRTWDRAAEAERFEQECSWALRWKMWPETYAAADSAWQLGRHNETVAAARLKSLVGQMAPDRGFLFNYRDNYFIATTNRQYDPIRNVAWTTQPPQDSDVGHAIEAASTFVQISGLPETTWNARADWLNLGTNILETASAVIAHRYFYGWRSNEFHPDLPVLRQAVRNLAATLPKERVRPFLFHSGGFWQESPAATAEIYRQAIESGEFNSMQAFARDIWAPFWVGWMSADRENGKRQWSALISDLQRSTNRTVRANAALLKLHQARFDPEIALAQEEFLDAVLDDTRARFSTQVGFSVLDSFDLVWSNRCLTPVTLRRTRLHNAWMSYDFARAKHYFQTARVHDVNRAGWPYAERIFTQDQARELLPVVNDYIRRIGGDWMNTVREHLQSLASKPTDPFNEFFADPVYDSNRFQRVFLDRDLTVEEAKRMLWPLRRYSNAHGWPEEVRALDRQIQQMLNPPSPPATNQPALSSVPVLKISRQIIPMFKDHRGELLPARAQGWVEHEGKIIAVGVHPRMGLQWPPPADGAHVIEVDPMTGVSQMLPQTLELETIMPPKFRAVGNQLFWIQNQNQLGILDRNSTGMRLCDVNIPLLRSELVALGRRLFIVSKDYIAEFSTTDHSLKLLASKRRKPAANQLDCWAGWSTTPKLWLHHTGTLFANLGGTNVWALNPESGEWKEWRYSGDRTGCPWTFVYDSSTVRCFDERVWIDGARQVLLATKRDSLPMWPTPFDFPLTPGFSSGQRLFHYSDGTNLWLLVPPLKRQPTQPAGTDMTLLWFEPEFEMPHSIPIQIEMRDGQDWPLSGFSITNIGAGLVLKPTEFSSSTSQLVLWLIPWSDLREWVARNHPPARNLPRSEPERRARFDKDSDGRLSTDEIQALEADKGASDREESALAQRLLLTFDSNRDNKLDLEELTPLASVPSDAIYRFADLPERPKAQVGWGGNKWQPKLLLLSFDLDNDKTLADQEVRELFRYIGARTRIREQFRTPQPNIPTPMRTR